MEKNQQLSRLSTPITRRNLLRSVMAAGFTLATALQIQKVLATQQGLLTPTILELLPVTADPSNLSAYSMWFRSDTNKVRVLLNAGIDNFVFEALAQTLTNKTINAANNTITNLAGSNFPNQNANQVFAGPASGPAAAAAFRLLVSGDIPSLPASIITSGQLAVARGGSGADLSATGGSSQYVKQSTQGGELSVGTIPAGDIPNTLNPTTFAAVNVTDKPLIAKGAASQTANLQEWQNSAGTALVVVDKSGNLGIGTSPSCLVDVLNGTLRVGGNSPPPTSGEGLEMGYSATSHYGFFFPYDRTGGAYKQLQIEGNPILITPNSASPVGIAYGSISGTTGKLLVNGNVGIGTISPAYTLDVAGAVHATSFPTSSDFRFKTDIEPIDNALDKVLRLNGVYFKWNRLHRDVLKRSNTDARQMGLIAQQVKEVIPEIVSEWSDKGADDYLAVDYNRLAAIMIEAIKELKAENKRLSNEMVAQTTGLAERLNLLESRNRMAVHRRVLTLMRKLVNHL